MRIDVPTDLHRLMFQQATKFAPRSKDPFLQAQEAGFQAVEFWLGPKLLDQWEEVAELAQSFSFEYALHFPNRAELSEKQLENLVQLYHTLSCSAMVIHQPMFDEYGDELFAIDSSLRLGIENHFLGSESKLRKWAKESPLLTVDIEHLWLFTYADASVKQLVHSVDSLFEEFGEKIVHVHLPGYVPGFKEHRPQYCSRGMVMKMFSLLADHDYDGFVVSETASRYQNPEELMMDRLLFRRWQRKREARQCKDAMETVAS